MAARHRILDLDWHTWDARVRENPLVIVPVGALEAHGPHLPLGSDTIQAEVTSQQLAERVGAFIAPTLSYGVCPEARRFTGTVSLTIAELEAGAAGLFRELARMGVRRVLVISGHAERAHMSALREAADQARQANPNIRIVVLSDYDFVYELRGKEAPVTDGHGGFLETSRVLALAPDTVGEARPVIAHRGSPFLPGTQGPEDWPDSVVGDTRGASAAVGQRVQDYVLRRLEETVRELLPA